LFVVFVFGFFFFLWSVFFFFFGSSLGVFGVFVFFLVVFCLWGFFFFGVGGGYRSFTIPPFPMLVPHTTSSPTGHFRRREGLAPSLDYMPSPRCVFPFLQVNQLYFSALR